MGVPIIDEAVTVITKVFDWFITSAPKPVQILIFILFITGLTFIVPSLLTTVGNQCTTDGDLFVHPVGDLLGNIRTSITAATLDEENGTQTPSNICRTGFITPILALNQLETDAPIARCTNCTFNNLTNVSKKCLNNGYRLDEDNSFDTNYNFFTRFTCLTFPGCAPPQGFFYDNTTQRYVCYKPFCQNITSEAEERYNRNVRDGGDFRPKLEGSDKFKILNIIKVRCDEETPGLYLFSSLNIFDPQTIILLILAGTILYIVLTLGLL